MQTKLSPGDAAGRFAMIGLTDDAPGDGIK